jgi:hypothetical protein
MLPPLLAVLALLGCASHAAALPAILQIQVIEGEGTVHPASSPTTKPLVLAITDQTGNPVPGAAVNLQLPGEGPSGTFGNGLKSDLIITGADGKVSVWGILLGATPGTVRLRVTAVKDQMRAGTIVPLHIGEAAPKSETPAEPSIDDLMKQVRIKGRTPWKWILAAAAASGSGLALGLARGGQKPQSAAPTAAPATLFQIGVPTITVGRP